MKFIDNSYKWCIGAVPPKGRAVMAQQNQNYSYSLAYVDNFHDWVISNKYSGIFGKVKRMRYLAFSPRSDSEPPHKTYCPPQRPERMDCPLSTPDWRKSGRWRYRCFRGDRTLRCGPSWARISMGGLAIRYTYSWYRLFPASLELAISNRVQYSPQLISNVHGSSSIKNLMVYSKPHAGKQELVVGTPIIMVSRLFIRFEELVKIGIKFLLLDQHAQHFS